MSNLTPAGRSVISELAMRYGLSEPAVEQMARAVSNGGGTMAQFNIPELGGGGQWMSGGMTMVGDMFNHGLQNTVANLCGELSNAMASTLFSNRRRLRSAGMRGLPSWGFPRRVEGRIRPAMPISRRPDGWPSTMAMGGPLSCSIPEITRLAGSVSSSLDRVIHIWAFGFEPVRPVRPVVFSARRSGAPAGTYASCRCSRAGYAGRSLGPGSDRRHPWDDRAVGKAARCRCAV